MADNGIALRRELRLVDLVLFNISAVVGVRWLSAAAHAGPGSITLWIVAALLFFIPSALVIASLSARFPEEGGMYIWTRNAFGDWHGFLCSWLYFLSVLLFFPALLVAGVAMASYMFGPSVSQWAENRWYAIPVTLAMLWTATFLNLLGLRIGKWVGNLGGLSTYAVATLLVVFGIAAAVSKGPATTFHLMPSLDWNSINFWSQIAFAFTGLELGPLMGGEIRNPRTIIPRAAWLSSGACAFFYIAGTAAMLSLMRPEQVSNLTGLAEAGGVAGRLMGAAWIGPCFAILITCGIFGQAGAFLAGNTRLPFAVGLDHHLPPIFARLHPRWGSPYVSILAQAIASTFFLIVMQLGETLRAAYQLLVDMDVIVTFIPFLYIFAAGFKFGQRIAGALGFAVSVAAILLSMAPPSETSGLWIFELKIIGGSVLLGGLGWLVFTQHQAHVAQS